MERGQPRHVLLRRQPGDLVGVGRKHLPVGGVHDHKQRNANARRDVARAAVPSTPRIPRLAQRCPIGSSPLCE